MSLIQYIINEIYLKTGYVAIAPFVFIINIFQEEGVSVIRFNIYLEELSMEKRTEIIKNFYDNDNTQEWKILE